jgi:OPA family glycerol-3-phosphate transporter-like MFS transporter
VPSGLIIISIAVLMQGALRDSITTWVPTYLTEVYGLGAMLSVIASMVLPLLNLAGVYAASWLNTHVLRDELSTSAVLYILSLVCLGFMVAVSCLPMVLSLLLLAITTSAMHAINTMLISLLPMYFTRMRRVSTVSGMLNAVVYMGSALSAYGVGALSDWGGWGATQIAWCLMCAAGVGLCLLGRAIWNPYKRNYL